MDDRTWIDHAVPADLHQLRALKDLISFIESPGENSQLKAKIFPKALLESRATREQTKHHIRDEDVYPGVDRDQGTQRNVKGQVATLIRHVGRHMVIAHFR